MLAHTKLKYLSLTDDDVHRLQSQCMYYLHKYMDEYSMDELIDDVLAFGLLKAAILGLTLKVVVSQDVINCDSVLFGLTIHEQLLLFEVQPTQANHLIEADLYLVKMQLEERLKHALQNQFEHESPLNSVQNFFNQTFSPM